MKGKVKKIDLLTLTLEDETRVRSILGQQTDWMLAALSWPDPAMKIRFLLRVNHAILALTEESVPGPIPVSSHLRRPQPRRVTIGDVTVMLELSD